MIINTLLLALTSVQLSNANNCFFCVSPDKQYNATVRRQLATQTDIFFYPIGVKTMTCSDYIDPEYPAVMEGQICSKYPMCVTLFPNLPNTSFVVRGCFESILRHTFREDLQLHEPGCYLVRSLPMYPNTVPMDYIICTCHGNYCNGMSIPQSVSKPYSFHNSNVLKLSSPDPEQPLGIVSSTPTSFAFHLYSFLLGTYFVL